MFELKKLFENEYVVINANKEMKTIEYAWKEFVTTNVHKNILEKIFEYTRELGYKKHLIDMREMKVLTEEQQAYVQKEWFPRMLKIGIKAMALINTKSVIAKLSVDRLKTRVDYGGSVFQSGNFDNIDEARKWLADIKEIPSIAH